MKSNNEKKIENNFNTSAIKSVKLEYEYNNVLIDKIVELISELEKDIKKIFFRNTLLIKHGNCILDTIKNMNILLSKEDSNLDYRFKIINEMKDTAEKILDENKKENEMKFISLLEERNILRREGINIRKDINRYHEYTGNYAIKCGKGLISLENFKKKYSNLHNKIGDYIVKWG